MLSMRLTCILALAGLFGFGVATVACTQQVAATPSKGDDDDSAADDDDDTTTTKKDGGSSSGSTSSSSSGGSILPVDSGPPPKSALTFFITSTPASADGSGNLGGLDGADKKCQDLATAVKAGDHKWAAFLGSQTPTVNPKDRIGKGPWKNQKGEVVAADVPSLFGTTTQLADSLFIDEKGAAIPTTGRFILTGSLGDGTAAQNNCKNWTDATQNAAARFGDTTPSANPVLGANWAFANKNPVNNNNSNCTAAGLKAAKSEARIACFATD